MADRYKDGIAVTNDGAVRIAGLASGVLVPSTAAMIPGSAVPGGKMVVGSGDGALYVRFV